MADLPNSPLLLCARAVEERDDTNFGYGLEQVFQDPCQPWTGEFDGRFCVDFQELDAQLAIGLVRYDKINSEQLKCIRDRLRCISEGQVDIFWD